VILVLLEILALQAILAQRVILESQATPAQWVILVLLETLALQAILAQRVILV
jgi:Tfp pilus assembly ATPase PilU